VTVGEDIPEHVEQQAVHREGGEPGVHLQGEGAQLVPDLRLEPGVNCHLAAGPGKQLQALDIWEHVLEILRPKVRVQSLLIKPVMIFFLS